jgi:colanic acid/amylovoran biosynthesis glycosyltransferase
MSTQEFIFGRKVGHRGTERTLVDRQAAKPDACSHAPANGIHLNELRNNQASWNHPKMRIAFLLDIFPKTSETFIVSQIVGLIERGHTVDIFARYRNRDDPVDPRVKKYQLIDRTQYLILMSRKERVLAAAKIILKGGWRRPLHLLRSMNVFRYGKAAINLEMLCRHAFLLKTPAYDIIHCHFGPVGIFGQHLRDIGAVKSPLLTTFHGYDVASYVAQRGTAVYDELFRKGEAFTCSSNFIRGKLIAAGCDPAKIFLFKLGTDLTKFNFLERRVDSDGAIRLITVGRLVEKKGLEYSIKAVANLVRQFPKLEYTIVGDGYLRQPLSLLIERLNLQRNVALVGWKTQEEVRRLFAKSHIFILASVVSSDGDFEGQGMVLQEAQAMGLPVVCTNHNGFSESILDGQSGFLVPERDADALSAKLAELIGQPDLWLEIGKKGRAFVEAEFDLSKRNDALVELYRRVMTEKSEPNTPVREALGKRGDKGALVSG